MQMLFDTDANRVSGHYLFVNITLGYKNTMHAVQTLAI